MTWYGINGHRSTDVSNHLKCKTASKRSFFFFFNFIKNISVQTADHHGDASLQLQMTSFGSDISRDGLKQKKGLTLGTDTAEW